MSAISEPGISNAKASLRAAALARRDALSTDKRGAAAQAIAARALPISVTPGQVIAGYAPIRSEIDPLPLMRVLVKQGGRLALPVVIARDQPLVFRSWSPDIPLVQGAFGIGEPSVDAPVLDPDIVLVPLAGFDRAGHRIGYGAGFYDRTLQRLRVTKPIVVVGLAFSVQEVDHVPALPHDMRLDYIATERETIEIRS
jgi:5-formyltetrahydrofolate cyclo-ligase